MMKSKHEESPKLADRVNVKIFPLDIQGIKPAPSSDEHEVCDKKMYITLNENDDDGDGIKDVYCG